MHGARLSQRCHHGIGARRKHVGASGDDFPKVVVVESNQGQQLLMFFSRKIRAASLKQARQNQVILKKTATAAPAQFGEFKIREHVVIFNRSGNALDQLFLELSDRTRRIETLRTYVYAIHDRVAAEQTIRVFKIVESALGILVAAVGNETIGGK